jgi:hypothetical protein
MTRFSFPRPTAPACAAAILLLASAAAQAQAEVRFGPADKFSDVREVRNVEADVEAPLAELLQKLAEKHLPGQKLVIDISDIDLAGEIEPVGSRMERIRVMRSSTWPHITLHYSLLDASGKEVRSGDAKLADMNYQQSVNSFSNSGPLRYESDMLARWFAREFGASSR